jgi:hypothetical protein
MKQLARQRIRYLIESGNVFPPDEYASKNFVVTSFVVIAALQSAIEYLFLR